MVASKQTEAALEPAHRAQDGKPAFDHKLARRLVLDELFDLSLYRTLQASAVGQLRAILERLIPIEARHYAFWQDFFNFHVDGLGLARRLKLRLIVLVCRLFGAPAIHLVLEAIEVYGVRKYLKVWRAYGGTPLASAVRSVLEDEFKHEDAALPSLIAAGSLIAIVSTILAFLSGMEIRRRVLTNLVMVAAAVGVTFVIGRVAKLMLGVSV